MKFSYQVFRGFYYPIIPIKISKDGEEINTSAIVDSGASISIFNGSVGRRIGIDVESGEKRAFQGASAKMFGYAHNVKMIVAGKEINCRVAFSDELATSFNLLGRESVFDMSVNRKAISEHAQKSLIFDDFLIIFNEKNRELSIEPV